MSNRFIYVPTLFVFLSLTLSVSLLLIPIFLFSLSLLLSPSVCLSLSLDVPCKKSLQNVAPAATPLGVTWCVDLVLEAVDEIVVVLVLPIVHCLGHGNDSDTVALE